MKFNIKDYNSKVILGEGFKLWLSFLIIFVVTTKTFATTPAPNTSLKIPSAKAIEASKETVKALEGVRQAIDMKTTSLEFMAEALKFDPDTAVEYVTNKIGMLPYLGSMRGPIGAMETGSASVLDQALLLGGLLDIMGVDVVLAHGQLNSSDTNRLMGEVMKVKAPESAIDNVKINQLGIPKPETKQSPKQNSPSAKDINTRLNKIAASLSNSLEPQTTDPMDKIRADVRKNYVWVRYRDLPTDPWIDVHPAFAESTSPSPTIKSYSQVEIPKERGHTFGFKLILEVTKKGKARETTLAHFKPKLISELAVQQIDLTLVPAGMNPTDITGASKASYFHPLINGKSPSGAKAFSTRGKTVNADVVTSGKSGAAASSLFGDLIAKLNSTDTKSMESQPHVTGLWIEAVYKNPLGEQIRRRPLVDLSASKPGDLVSATGAMLRTIIDFNIGQTNLARTMDYQTNAMISQVQRLPYIAAVASDAMTMAEYNAESTLIGLDNQDVWLAMAMAHELYLPARYEEQVVLPLTALVSTMTASTLKNKHESEVKIRGAMDLMFTDTLILNNSAITLDIDRLVTMRLGIFRTLVETLMIKGNMNENPLTKEVVKLTKFNNEKAIKSIVKETTLDTRTAERLTRDFKSAGTIIIGDVPKNSELRWWKLNQLTGEVLGMGTTGGTEAQTYILLEGLAEKNSVSVAFFVMGVWSCAAKGHEDAWNKLGPKESVDNFQNCLAKNTVLYFAGGMASSILTSQMNTLNAFSTGLLLDLFASKL